MGNSQGHIEHALLVDFSPLEGGFVKKNTYEREDQGGNVDFVYLDRARGVAWVADTVGHNWPEEKGELKEKVQNHWKDWKTHWGEGPFTAREDSSLGSFIGTALPKSVPWEKSKKYLQKWLFRMSNTFEKFAVSSTFTLVCLVNYKEGHYTTEKKKGLISLQVGDSGAIRFSKESIPPPNGEEGPYPPQNRWVCKPLTDFLGGEISNVELAGDVRKAAIQIQPVEPGDIIIGATDGVWSPLLRKYQKLENLVDPFSSILRQTPQVIADKVWEEVDEVVKQAKREGVEGGEEVLKGDDVAIFVVKIPE